MLQAQAGAEVSRVEVRCALETTTVDGSEEEGEEEEDDQQTAASEAPLQCVPAVITPAAGPGCASFILAAVHGAASSQRQYPDEQHDDEVIHDLEPTAFATRTDIGDSWRKYRRNRRRNVVSASVSDRLLADTGMEVAAHLMASGGEKENRHPAVQKLSAVQEEIVALKAELGM